VCGRKYVQIGVDRLVYPIYHRWVRRRRRRGRKEERWYNLIRSKKRENDDKSSSLSFFFFFCTRYLLHSDVLGYISSSSSGKENQQSALSPDR
jgi:hypothetical protein